MTAILQQYLPGLPGGGRRESDWQGRNGCQARCLRALALIGADHAGA